MDFLGFYWILLGFYPFLRVFRFKSPFCSDFFFGEWGFFRCSFWISRAKKRFWNEIVHFYRLSMVIIVFSSFYLVLRSLNGFDMVLPNDFYTLPDLTRFYWNLTWFYWISMGFTLIRFWTGVKGNFGSHLFFGCCQKKRKENPISSRRNVSNFRSEMAPPTHQSFYRISLGFTDFFSSRPSWNLIWLPLTWFWTGAKRNFGFHLFFSLLSKKEKKTRSVTDEMVRISDQRWRHRRLCVSIEFH